MIAPRVSFIPLFGGSDSLAVLEREARMIALKAREPSQKGAQMGLVLAGGVLVAFAWAAGVQTAEPKPSACDAMVGVWEYLPPSAPGHAVIGRGGSKYVGVFYNTVPASDAPRTAPSTDAEKAILYSRGGPGAWEYTCEASAGKLRLKLRWLFSSYSPALVGSEGTLEVEPDGNAAKWWSIGPNGERGAMGAGRLLK